MKKLLFITFGLIIGSIISAQIVTTNRNSVGMEHNMLFNANSRYSVTQTGSATLNLDRLFDGKFLPSYTSTAPSVSDPTVILVENLPGHHIQLHAVVGWSTRGWPANRFKIEGYDVYQGRNIWKTITDYSSQDYSGKDYYIDIKDVTSGKFTKFRFTFYSATGTNGRLGVSELFFLHPEAATPYEGLLVSTDNSWKISGSDLYYNSGNVGIGTTSPETKLHIENGVVKSGTGNATQGTLQFAGDYSGDNILNTYGSQYSSGATSIGYAVKQKNGSVGIVSSAGNAAFKKGMLIIDNELEFLSASASIISINNDANLTSRFIINQYGNVGIGTTNPQTKLAVNGEITTKEVIVTMDGWSDFVFEPAYKLIPLENLEQFIKRNKHLPDVPSAKEVKENGLSLGQNDAILLQKVEELTLYLIEQNKNQKELLRVVKSQQEEIKQLKKEIKHK